MIYTGRVVEEHKNYFVVDTPSGLTQAVITGQLRNNRERVCTGDNVEIQITDMNLLHGIIIAIKRRTTFIQRPPLANCSHFLCFCTIKEPPVHFESLDRLLFSVMVSGIVPCIVINKTDLVSSAEEMELFGKIVAVYQSAGFKVFAASALTGEGVGAIVEFCRGRITALAGLSGIGKTSLLSRIFPDVAFRIGALSASFTRGKHTTTSTRLLPINGGGYIADTPGLSSIDLPVVPEEAIAGYFGEMTEYAGLCRFNNCRHENEPGCAVVEKMHEGVIANWRYKSYLKIYDEMRRYKKQYKS